MSDPKSSGRAPPLAGEPTLPPTAPEAATAAPAAAAHDGAGRPFPPGYELLAELGRGGMGVVYKARHTKLNRTVALKMVLAGGHAGKDELARFLTEAEAVARLDHPNIVPLYEFGEHAGLPFFTLEFVAGGTLATRLAGARLAPREAARVVALIARAMHCAHQAGIVHRDLKPANVLLAKDGTPKVADFGLARRVEVGPGLTATGAVLGTPSYMAPEQADGKGKEAGPAADVYALGAILYECLTGRPPFKAATHLDTLMQVVSAEPVPPRQIRPKVPRDLDTICLKCLEKDPAKRYPTALALAADLRRHLDHEPIRARRTGVWERTAKFVRRQPVLATLLVLVSLGVILGMAQTIYTSWRFGQLMDPKNHMPPAPVSGNAAPAVQPPAVRPPPSQTKTIRHVLPASGQRLWCVAFSPDGKTLAAAGDEGAVRLWASPLNTVPTFVPPLKGHDDSILALAFAPDGTTFATGSADRTVKVWETAARREKHTLSGHRRRVLAVAFSPNGKSLASAGDDEVIKLWDAATGAPLRDLRGHTDSVNGLAFAPGGKALASAGHDGAVLLWDPTAGKVRHTLRGHAGPVRAVAFSSDGKTLATGGADGGVQLWDAETGAKLDRLDSGARAPRVAGLAFGPGGRLLAAARENDVRVWEVETRKSSPAQVFSGSAGGLRCVAVSPDGKVIAFAGDDGKVFVQGPLTADAAP
jgi:serine/threonine protein kinase